MPDLLTVADVSEWQGPIDWSAHLAPAHKAGAVPAAIVRAYNGNRADHQWPANRSGFWNAAGTHGVLGIYSYLVADAARPLATQASEFIALVRSLRAGEFVMLDQEEGSGNQSARASGWRQQVEKALTTDAWLYAGLSYYETHDLSAAGFASTRTIIAAYQPSEPTSIAHALWQFTDAYGPMPGITAAHDANRFHGTAAALLAHVTGSPSPLPVPVPVPQPVHDAVPYPGKDAFVLGHSSGAVTLLGQWLIARGYGRFYVSGPGPVLGPHDVEACRQFQLDQGWSGADADGYPGPETWQRLQNPATRPVAHPLVPYPGRSVFALGRSDPSVTLLGQWLINKGYGRFYTAGPSPMFSASDRAATRAFQLAQGWSGADADGYPGPQTWQRLQQ